MLKSRLEALLPPRLDLLLRYVLQVHAGLGEREHRWVSRLACDIALDIGANRGVYARQLAGLSRKVHVFEPDPVLAPYLRATLSGNAELHTVALSDRGGEASLEVPVAADGRRVSTRATIAPGALAEGTEVVRETVRSVPLDEVTAGLDGAIDFIKIDVEGHEKAMLDGARETLRRHKPLLMVETEFRHGADVAGIFADLAALGYKAQVWRSGRLEPVTLDEFADLQSARPPEDRAYVNNVIFTPGA
ncbi:FkbM family methyltransferase [Pontivivens ytuae]|uniref:FkbM family methyltransferase n=1 Tax=Pontivivens ytuae TaxID=2789856 RepID=A0A7S9QD47_9RHOB|nr:FkbM family methyltransferase [Pontivivens ytuae]QPH54918.1 FkbM family methyltransferase [Pontivivens ytuae]